MLAAWVLTVLVGFVPQACSRASERAPGPLRVVVTVPPLVGLVKPLLPADASIKALLAPGRSEHGYEFTPKDLAALGTADVVVYVGLGLEPAVESFLKNNPRKGRRVCFARVAGIAGEEEHDHHDGHDEHTHAVDQHLWLDADLCATLVDEAGKALREAGEAVGATGAGSETSVRELKERLKAMDEENRRRLEPLRGRSIVTHHNAWQRLADRYGLRVAAVIREFDGEPTPGAIAAAVEAIKKQGAKAVFVEPQFDPRAAKQIAKAAGVRVATLDPLGDGDYFGMMHGNIDALVNALGD